MSRSRWRSWILLLLFVVGGAIGPLQMVDACCDEDTDAPQSCGAACACDPADDPGPAEDAPSPDQDEGDHPCHCPLPCCGIAKVHVEHRTSRSGPVAPFRAAPARAQFVHTLAPRDATHELLRPPIA